MTSRASHYRGKLERHLLDDVITPLRLIDESLAPAHVSGLLLGQIQDLGVLIPEAQKQHMPVIEMKTGNASLISEAKREFTALAAAVIKRAEAMQ